jgi:hypothetical protein
MIGVQKQPSRVKVERKAVLSTLRQLKLRPWASTDCSLVVIDGWGIPSETSPKDGDAIAAADTPVMDGFAKDASQTAQGYT